MATIRGIITQSAFIASAVAAPLGAQGPAASQPASPPGVRGFPRAVLADELARESALRAVPNADTLRAQQMILSAVPHEAGTER